MTMTQVNRARVLVLASHPSTRIGLQMLVNHRNLNYEFVGETDLHSVVEVRAAARRIAPDVILMDVPTLEHDEKFLWSAALASDYPVVLCLEDPSSLAPARRTGAVGCVSKGDAVEEILRALSLGLVWRYHTSASLPEVAHEPRTLLSERQTTVLRLVAAGMQTETMAQHLNVSVDTVKTHTRAACEKFGVSSRTGAVAQAIRQGII